MLQMQEYLQIFLYLAHWKLFANEAGDEIRLRICTNQERRQRSLSLDFEVVKGFHRLLTSLIAVFFFV